MARHPKEQRAVPETPAFWDRRASRRDFLKWTGAAGLAVGASGLLAACGKSTGATAGPSAKGTAAMINQALQLSRPDHPVELPIFPGNEPIKSGLAPEKGATLQIYNWVDYIYQKVVNEFAAHYNCKVQVTTFDTALEAMAKLQSGQVQFDVYFPTPDQLGRLVAGQIVQPLNHSYIPNISNCWPEFTNPFYDEKWRYTVPYTIYTTGIGYRRDKVVDPSTLSNPRDIYWDPKYKGWVYLLDDYRETITMALLRRGVTDVNTEDPALINRAKDDLIQLIDLVNVKLDVDDYTEIPDGRAWIHQSWSGDMVSAANPANGYLPKGTPPSVVGYWYPASGGGAIANDTMGVLKGAQNPVLAHLFLNWMLDRTNAYVNFTDYNGYQPPQNSINPDKLISDGVVTPELRSAVVTRPMFDKGYTELALTPAGDQLWQNAYAQFKAGV